MKLICYPNHEIELLETFKNYMDIDIVLVEKGMNYEGLAYLFDKEHIHELIQYLEKLKSKRNIVGYKHKRMYLISIDDIEYIEGFSKECYIHTLDDEYQSEYKLYELEEMLQDTSFIRISKSILVNLCFVDYILTEANMKYGLYMKSHMKLTLNRKYVLAFKQKIGKRGK